MFKQGDIVKLKCYDSFSGRRENCLAKIDSIANGVEDVGLKWASDNRSFVTKKDNLVKIKQYSINKISNRVKVGDIIVTNGDGSRASDLTIYGEIGEIAEKEGRKCFYLWNNIIAGSNGAIERPRKWKYSWLIYLSNKKAWIIFENELVASKKSDRGTECKECGEKFLKETMKEFEEDSYCLECFNKMYTKCEHCEEIVERNSEYECDGMQFCQECYDECVRTCSACEETFLEENLVYSERYEKYYCQQCYDEYFTSCNSCGEELHRNSDDRYRGPDDEDYCESCFNDRFGYCEGCQEYFRHDDLREGDNGCLYCNDCYGSEEDETPREETPRVRVVHDYGYKPSHDFKKMQWDSNLFMGIELEVQHSAPENSSAQKLVDFLKQEKVENMFYMKHDSSVPNGFEIVSHPFTLAYAHKELKLQKILKWMKEQGFDSEKSGSCGFHIHLSKDFFEELDITKLRAFFKVNAKKLHKLSKRGETGTSYYKFEETSIEDILNNVPQSGRYWALNLNSSENTLELRLFRGTLDTKRVIALLQFAEAISWFVKDVGITSIFIGEKDYHKNSWKLFIDWAKDQRKYETMLNYMKGEKLCA